MQEEALHLFFCLLRAGLRHAPGEPPALPGADEAAQVWDTVYRLGQRQGVGAILWDGMQLLAAEGFFPPEQLPPRRLKLQWAAQVDAAERLCRHQKRALASLAAFYEKHGIRTMVLKGYGLSLCYPEPEHRPSGDLDIYLFGRRKEADAWLRRERGIAVKEDAHQHTTFAWEGVPVENHYDFLNIHSHPSNRRIERRLKALAAEGIPAEVEGQQVVLPTAAFDALFLLRHAAVHFAAVGIGMRHLTDWALFIRRHHADFDREALEQTARRENMHRFLHAIEAIAVDRLGFDAALFPAAVRDEALERRVLDEVLAPGFDEAPPRGAGLIKGLGFKTRRWWAGRWKHRIVYRDGLVATFAAQTWSHLLKAKTLRE